MDGASGRDVRSAWVTIAWIAVAASALALMPGCSDAWAGAVVDARTTAPARASPGLRRALPLDACRPSATPTLG